MRSTPGSSAISMISRMPARSGVGSRVTGPRNRDADVPEVRVPQREIAERR